MFLYPKLSKSLQQFLGLIYPNLCFGCDELLDDGEHLICTHCRMELPIIANPVALEKLNEKLADINPAFVSSFLYFEKGNITQKLLHMFKYEGYETIGRHLGLWYGETLKNSGKIGDIDVVTPVPLHLKKRIKRGFNQSEILAQGIASAVGLPCRPRMVKRVSTTESQTRKSRFSRMMNVKQIFRVNDPRGLRNAHVLLVDDVVTTGSTLAACAGVLKASGARAVSVAALATAK